VGLAGAQAIRDGVTVKGLDVAKLQRLLVESGHLPARVLEPPPPPVPPHLTELVRDLTGEEPWEWLEMLATERATEVPLIASLCLADREQVVPLLRSALPGSKGSRRLLLSRLLLWHGCADGLPAVLQEIDWELQQGPGLPLCARDLWWVSGAPDHGVMPEVVYLLYALTRVRDERILGPFEEVVTRLEAADRDYASGETRVFDYIRMVALAAERLALPGFVPLLRRLLALPELAASVASPRPTDDHLEERKAILVLYLSRALARCGRKGGLLRLAGLLSDPRSLLARSALQELRALTGHTRPLAAEPWKKALENHPEEFPPMPWERELN
jgi:hypothetical protein